MFALDDPHEVEEKSHMDQDQINREVASLPRGQELENAQHTQPRIYVYIYIYILTCQNLR